MAEFASKGIAGSGLGLGIAGTALGLMNNGGLGGIFSGGCSENVAVNRYDLEREQKIAKLETEIALRDASIYTDGKMNDMRNYIDSRLNGIEAQLCQQNVYNATNTATLNCLSGQIAQLQALTKVIVPIGNVCPEPMAQYNSWTAPTA